MDGCALGLRRRRRRRSKRSTHNENVGAGYCRQSLALFLSLSLSLSWPSLPLYGFVSSAAVTERELERFVRRCRSCLIYPAAKHESDFAQSRNWMSEVGTPVLKYLYSMMSFVALSQHRCEVNVKETFASTENLGNYF